ncbi:hypothetical protein [Serratia proteamaculans]|uniref:hypothetical protein n=1 Tax=Serratia proteamaculans TaxID=28151 RepID=UPI00102020F4|nr:hypothetical protein [Serratia proteamaculans]KAB1499263.1 hypothetical protein F8R23_07440 [Serratia proteamaculans]RYM50370.1 hypothetical protein BSQ96_16350 [Serratia proteamaculans]CAI0721942.1 Uncharacterised protein [Serratia proteamaculans]CAI0723362.1 Uncharacterised protein [Serratia proteamaculans]CAI0849678.1 Uncharacterised protein [Serratia proteamaculans]
MNIETFARLIEATDVSVFRSIAAIVVPLIGLGDADYCDGPYDGGKDFNLAVMPASGVNIGIQISVEKKWQNKINSDAIKLKKNYDTNIMYFLSSRRIPEGTYATIKEEIFLKHGVTINKYDSQAIATRLINHNKVKDALLLMGVNVGPATEKQKEYLGPKNEAVSSLLLFDQKTKDLRQRFFQSIIMSVLSREINGFARNSLLNEIKTVFNIQENQLVQINSNIDSLLQGGEIINKRGVITLSAPEKDRFAGLKKTTELELEILKIDFKDKVSSLATDIDDRIQDLLVDNFLELTIYLSGKNYSTYDGELKHNDAYNSIREIIASNFGQDQTSEIFKELSAFFATSDFAKHVACAKLYDAFLNTNSSHLINALGGTENLNVYIDSSVFIPIICSLLFDKVKDRFSQSGSSLYKLISNHSFKAIIPYDYMEEVASHLIEACRDYKHIIEQDVDLSHSGNAFVSHYSKYKKNNADVTFNDYVKVFGVRLSNVSADMSDSSFYAVRDRSVRELSSISSKYNFSVEKFPVEFISSKIEELQQFLSDENITRPEVLVRHDARVIGYLSGDYVQSGIVKLLCTWDKVHSSKNPDGNDGYYVMHPIAVIDYFSLAKGNEDVSISHLLDFSMMQEETDLELSSKIWDTIARIESDNLSDASLLISAKNFKEQYMIKHANDEKVASKQVEVEWMAWKK